MKPTFELMNLNRSNNSAAKDAPVPEIVTDDIHNKPRGESILYDILTDERSNRFV